MVDPTIRGVGLLVDLASLILDLVIMVIIDLEMMSLNWKGL